MASARPVRESPSHTPEPADMERKDRIRAQLVAGERIATRDIQPGEYFVQLHRAILRALNTAHRLTAAQRQYLGVLMEYSYGYRSPWAIRDMADRRPPSLGDWCNWLGGWSSEQICGVRKQLLDLRVIQYVEQNSSYVALNETWEEWDQELFTRHEKRAGAGRPGKINSRINAQEGDAPLIRELTGANLRINPVNSQIKLNEFTNSPTLIRELTDDPYKAASQEGGTPALNNRRTEELINTRRKGTHSHLQEFDPHTQEEKTTGDSSTPEEHLSPTTLLGPITETFTSQPANDQRNSPQAHQFNATSQAVLFPAIPMPALSGSNDAEQQKSRSSRRRSRPTSERKIPPQNMLYEVWKVIKPPATERQQKNIIIGLAELSNTEKTLGHPVTPVELPGLMYQTMSWIDRKTGKNYTPSPWKIADWLSDLRDEVRDYPCPRARAWQSWQMQQAEEAPGAAGESAQLIEMVRAFEAYLLGGSDADPSVAEGAEEEARVAREGEVSDREQTGEIISADEAEDFSWTARLRRHVPDPDGARHGRYEQEVRILWGFVRDELRPGLNTARRQHLDALTAAWDPEQPYTLLLLSSRGYTVNFIGAALMREINERVEKLLSRFFERAKVMTVPQRVIDHLCADPDAKGMSDE